MVGRLCLSYRHTSHLNDLHLKFESKDQFLHINFNHIKAFQMKLEFIFYKNGNFCRTVSQFVVAISQLHIQYLGRVTNLLFCECYRGSRVHRNGNQWPSVWPIPKNQIWWSVSSRLLSKVCSRKGRICQFKNVCVMNLFTCQNEASRDVNICFSEQSTSQK